MGARPPQRNWPKSRRLVGMPPTTGGLAPGGAVLPPPEPPVPPPPLVPPPPVPPPVPPPPVPPPGSVPVACWEASATLLAPSCTGAAAVFTPVTVTPQRLVRVPCTLPATVARMPPSSGILRSWATTALAIVPPVMNPVPVGRAPIGMGGSAANALPTALAMGGPRIGTARTASTTTPSTALGARETGWPGVPWTDVAQLPTTMGGGAASAELAASKPAADPMKASASAAAKPFTRRPMSIPPGRYWRVAPYEETTVARCGDADQGYWPDRPNPYRRSARHRQPWCPY